MSDFDLIHELAARYGRLMQNPEGFLDVPTAALTYAFHVGGAEGLISALREQMERERAEGEKVAARAFQRAEDSSRLDWLTSGGEEETR